MTNVQAITQGVDEQGYNANKTGKDLENQVEKYFLKYGIKSVYYSKLDTEESQAVIASSPRGYLLKNVPYTNEFGANAYGEFLLYLHDIGVYRIECRAQHVPGSAQDKLVKLLFDCNCMEEKNVFIVMEGNGFTEKARKWIVDNARAIKTKNIDVRSLVSFKDWVDDTLGNVVVPIKQTFVISNIHKAIKNKPLKIKEIN